MPFVETHDVGDDPLVAAATELMICAVPGPAPGRVSPPPSPIWLQPHAPARAARSKASGESRATNPWLSTHTGMDTRTAIAWAPRERQRAPAPASQRRAPRTREPKASPRTREPKGSARTREPKGSARTREPKASARTARLPTPLPRAGVAVELASRRRLVDADPSWRDARARVAFRPHWHTGHPAQHRELAHVRQRISERPLNQLFG